MLHMLHAATEVKKSVPKEVQKFLPQAGSVYEAKKRLVINGDKYLLPSLLYCNRFQGCDF